RCEQHHPSTHRARRTTCLRSCRQPTDHHRQRPITRTISTSINSHDSITIEAGAPCHRSPTGPATLSYGGKVPERHDLPMPQVPGEGDELPPPMEPVADNSVRVAWAADAEAIGAVQLRAWTHSYANVLPSELLNQLTAGEIAEVWTQAMIRPPTARHRVLV